MAETRAGITGGGNNRAGECTTLCIRIKRGVYGAVGRRVGSRLAALFPAEDNSSSPRPRPRGPGGGIGPPATAVMRRERRHRDGGRSYTLANGATDGR